MSARIVVFDHSPTLLKLYDAVLRPRGYEVFGYQQDMTDFREVEALSPDLILLGNVTAFDEHQLDLLEQIRTRPQTQHLPVLVATTAIEPLLNFKRLRAFGSVYVLSKPFAAQHLLAAVQQALASSHDEKYAYL
jgi:CheY-like chemotaxis protein